MFAIIATGGKQYPVSLGQTLRVEKLAQEVGKTIEFDQVLLTGEDDKTEFGAPFIKGCQVKAEVVSHGRAKKIRIIKFKRRKHSMKQMGHRQDFTEIKITQIGAKSATKPAAKKAETKPAVAKKASEKKAEATKKPAAKKTASKPAAKAKTETAKKPATKKSVAKTKVEKKED